MTNKAKHTPGPWRAVAYSPKSLGFQNGKAWYIISDDGTPAFQVLKSQTFDHRNGKTGHFYDPSAMAKDAVNARLIAAAPELLAALENIASMADTSGDKAILAEAREAIAKARGR